MKKITLLILTAVLTIFSTSAQVRKCPAMGGKPGSCERPGMGRPEGRRGMMQKLELTEQQKSSIKSLRREKQSKLAELEKNDKMTMADFRSRRDAINKEYKGKMENLLTPDQKNRIAEEKKNREADREKRMSDHLDRMKADLSLSDAQVSKIKDHHAQMRSKMKSIRENSSLGPEQKKMQMKQAREEGKKEMESILTPDQMKKHLDKQKDRKEMMKKHHRGGDSASDQRR